MKRKIPRIFAVFCLVMLFLSSVVFAWPSYLDGRPSEFRPGQSRGFFIWRDQSGFNLRTTASRQGHVFSGIIRTDGDFLNVRLLRNEQSDRVRLDQDRDTIRFKFRTVPGDADGFDFRMRGGRMIHFELLMDGQPVHFRAIRLGAGNRNPRGNSFRIHRSEQGHWR